VNVNVLFLALMLILLERANVEDMPKVIFAVDLSFQSLSLRDSYCNRISHKLS